MNWRDISHTAQQVEIGMMSKREFLTRRREQLPPEHFGYPSELIATLRQGIAPAAVMVTCWELCDAPDDISHAEPGQILIAQNPGGLVAPYGDSCDGTMAAIEFGLSEPGVRHLIVCGHLHCRTLEMLLDEDHDEDLPGSRAIVAGLREHLHNLKPSCSPRQRRALAVQETVLQQLVHLRSYPEIRSRLNTGRLHLHGWIYNELSPRVSAYNPFTGRFTP